MRRTTREDVSYTNESTVVVGPRVCQREAKEYSHCPTISVDDDSNSSPEKVVI